MEVVEDAKQMPAALERMSDVDLILIDTAGRSPRSDARISQLRQMLQAARPDETHLVVSATSSRETIDNILDGFAPVEPTAMISVQVGRSGAACRPHCGAGQPFATVNYITNGQHVPDDIRVASASEIANSLLSTHLTSGSLPRYLHAQRAA